MRDAVLYFPTIGFRSRAWLNASLLVWDHVYRIAPQGYRPDDDTDISFAEDEGLVRSIAPDSADLAATAVRFEDLWESLGNVPSGFSTESPTDNVHIDKIDSRLYPLLEENAGEIHGNIAQLPREMARLYMLVLAQEIARRRSLVLATDDPDAWVVEAYVREEGDFSDHVYDGNALYQYCHLGFSSLLPVDASELNMVDLARISRSSAAARKEFRAVAGSFLASLAQCESAEHATQLAEDLRRHLTESVAALRSHYMPFNRSGLSSLLAVGAPIVASALPAFFPSASGVYPLVPTMVSVGVVAALADYYRPRPHPDNIGAYFLQVDRALAKKGLIHDLQARMEEFIND